MIILGLILFVGALIMLSNRKNGTEIAVTLRRDYGINRQFKNK